MSIQITPAARNELAPSGTLRVGLNMQNFLLVNKDPKSGEPYGIVPDLARELSRVSGLPLEFVQFDRAGKLAEAVREGAWDVAFLAAEPARAKDIAFTPAYLEIDATYLVPAGSPIRSLAEVDRTGVRIAAAEKSAYDLYLTRTLKHATLVRTPGIDASYEVGEFFAGSFGIGYLVGQAATMFETDLLFACVVIIATVGIGASIVLQRIERHFQRWRPKA